MCFKELIKFYNNELKPYFNSDWIGGVGVGFESDSIIATKLYINFEKDIDINLFPFSSLKPLYKDFLQYKDYNRCANDSIAIKRYIKENIYSEYFHIKLKHDFSFNISDRLLNINLDKLEKGVSVEKIVDSIKIKRYYYIREKFNIAALLKYFNIKEDYNNIKYIEYTSDPKKIILVFEDFFNVEKCLENNLSSFCFLYSKNISIKYNSKPVLFGRYFSSEINGVYWDLYNNSNIINLLYE